MEVNYKELYEDLISDIEKINCYICFSDKVYEVREQEGKGWDGFQVKDYIRTVERVEKRIKEFLRTIS